MESDLPDDALDSDLPEAEPESDFALPPVALAPPPDLLSVPPESPARLRLPSDLKSVSYHPDPFNRNPAAEISLLRAAAPHSGQSVGEGSDILRLISATEPQSPQRYS